MHGRIPAFEPSAVRAGGGDGLGAEGSQTSGQHRLSITVILYILASIITIESTFNISRGIDR